MLLETGKAVEAESEVRAALAIHRALVDANPDNANREGVAEAHRSLGKVLVRSGNSAAGAAEIRAAIAYRQAIADANPTLHSSRATLAENHRLLAALLTATPRVSETEAEYRLATSLFEKLAGEPGADAGSRESLAQVHNDFGYWLTHGTNRLREAKGEHRAAQAIAQEMVDKNPAMPDYRFLLALTHESLGKVLRMSDRLDEAEAEYRASAAILTKLAAESPDVRRFSNQLAHVIDDLSDVLRSRGRAAEARDGYERALQLFEGPGGTETQKRNPHDETGYTVRRRGLARRDLGDLAGAAADARRRCRAYEGASPQRADEWFEVACCHALLADLAGRDGSGVATADAASRGRRGDGPPDPGRRDGIPRHRPVSHRVGPRYAPSAGRLPSLDDGPGHAGQPVRPPRLTLSSLKLVRVHGHTGRPLGEEAYLATLERRQKGRQNDTHRCFRRKPLAANPFGTLIRKDNHGRLRCAVLCPNAAPSFALTKATR